MDITACGDNSCIKFEECFRAQCEKNPYRQSYFMWPENKLDEHKTKPCEYFYKMEK